jgi:hypothetical protein
VLVFFVVGRQRNGREPVTHPATFVTRSSKGSKPSICSGAHPGGIYFNGFIPAMTISSSSFVFRHIVSALHAPPPAAAM